MGDTNSTGKQQEQDPEDTLGIEISFPRGVHISEQQFKNLVEICDSITRAYERRHPGRVMWPAGMGSKITRMPITAEQEKEFGMEFDSSILEISCREREDFDWLCAKCGLVQGDHKDLILDPPAGNCDFKPMERETYYAERRLRKRRESVEKEVRKRAEGSVSGRASHQEASTEEVDSQSSTTGELGTH